ncbi:GNAT family N-acetyltransferase [Bacteroides zoogleoformans]|uniref:RimJ/RimL family protein N-acetyltransferase n=1 Tax=Bacteroides zoogleoformans TaxID=28119 RepID=A0ABN5IHU4_9BACE|nr:GNAT family N-acetyltransferase [Bacteroides zoogleoformans]AVM52304.1 hypothetical protein C4H11_04510 [Bacteroides zoogleoformans]
MRLIEKDFTYEKYGLHARLVEESDAEFIFRLRSDATRSKYIHDIEGGVENQVEWIRNYKKREEEGTDYYFIFYRDEIPVGLNRIYSIHDRTYTGGSWVMAPEASMEEVIACPIMMREIAFEVCGMEFEDDYDACHVDNKKVIKYNLMSGMKICKHFQDVKGEYVAMSMTKEDFESHKPKLLKMIGY